MRKIFIILALSMSVLGRPLVALALDDAIIAIVNNEVITLKDLQDYIHGTYVSLVAEGIDETRLRAIMQELQENGVNKLIEDKLILSKANALGLEVRDKLVDDRLQEIKKKYPSEEVFVEALVKNGATITDLRKKILEQFKIQYVIEYAVKSKIFVNPQEVTEFYEQNIDVYRKKERVNLDSIFIPFDKDTENARVRAAEALQALQDGDTFQNVAQKYSQGTPVGVVERGQLQPEIEQEIFYLKEGDVSAPVDTENGIYIFKVLGKFPGQTAELKEVKDTIYDLIYKRKFKDRFTKWLEKLKEDAYIEIKQ